MSSKPRLRFSFEDGTEKLDKPAKDFLCDDTDEHLRSVYSVAHDELDLPRKVHVRFVHQRLIGSGILGTLSDSDELLVGPTYPKYEVELREGFMAHEVMHLDKRDTVYPGLGTVWNDALDEGNAEQGSFEIAKRLENPDFTMWRTDYIGLGNRPLVSESIRAVNAVSRIVKAQPKLWQIFGDTKNFAEEELAKRVSPANNVPLNLAGAFVMGVVQQVRGVDALSATRLPVDDVISSMNRVLGGGL